MTGTLAEVVNVPLSVHLCCCSCWFFFPLIYVCSVNSITVCYLCFLFLKCLMLRETSLGFLFLIDCWWMPFSWLRRVAFVLYLGIVICVVFDQPCHIWLSCWIFFCLCIMYIYVYFGIVNCSWSICAVMSESGTWVNVICLIMCL